MSALGNKAILSNNLKYYIEQSGKDRRELADIWGFPYSTVTEWVNGKKYPRIDRIEIMANYFGILKSDLIEERTDNPSIRQIFPARLRLYMDVCGKTRSDIADALRVSYSAVRDWEEGYAMPRADKIAALTRLFGCTVADLLEEKKEPATDDGSELTKRKRDFIEKVRQMSAADLARFEETLRFVEKMK